MIKFSQHRTLKAIHDVEQVYQDGFPDPQFKFMQQVNDKHKEKIKTCVAQSFWKGILDSYNKTF